uniref:Serpin-ZXB-like n=1 Tax=Nicotiana sylvestris TaxID=4096 RepID=A0A1U7VB71_NICSY|nr:PREDICTED: serpin-ZXB-like [Nicotiana sylvestris]
MSYTSLNTVEFVADVSFLFLIREDATCVILFTGNVLNPLSE